MKLDNDKFKIGLNVGSILLDNSQIYVLTSLRDSVPDRVLADVRSSVVWSSVWGSMMQTSLWDALCEQ